MSKLYFSYAAMNAGKSTILLQASYNYRERGMRTLLFTSALYAELDEGQISSRIGVRASAELFDAEDDLFAWIKREHEAAKVDCVFVDEAQFLTKDQVWQLARVSDRLNIPVLCYGLRTDFRGELFPGAAMANGAHLSEVVSDGEQLRGAKATMVMRRDESGAAATKGEQVSIEKSVYVSLCRKHWEDETGHGP